MIEQDQATQRPTVKIQRGISLEIEDDRIARELAAKRHGDNISRLFRHLLRDAWAKEQQGEQAA